MCACALAKAALAMQAIGAHGAREIPTQGGAAPLNNGCCPLFLPPVNQPAVGLKRGELMMMMDEKAVTKKDECTFFQLLEPLRIIEGPSHFPLRAHPFAYILTPHIAFGTHAVGEARVH